MRLTHRVLLVDDEAEILFAVQEYLRGEGYQVDCATNLTEVAQLLEATSYGLVITDLRLANTNDSSGLDVLRFARLRNPAPRAVLWTAYGNTEVENAAHDAGADLVLDKSMPLSRLAELARALLARRS